MARAARWPAPATQLSEPDWQAAAPARADEAHDLIGASQAVELDQRIDKLMVDVFATLASPLFTNPPPPMHLLGDTDADWGGFVPWVLERVRGVNALSGPRLRVVHGSALRRLGRIPRWPDDAAFVLDLEDALEEWRKRQDRRGRINGRIFCLSMFSHRWTRPSSDARVAHPDSDDHLKARSLAYYGEVGTCSVYPLHRFDYFFWIDFAGVHQDNLVAKSLGIAKLPLFVAVAIEVVFFFTAEYEGRAWTRLERALGFVFNPSPMFVLIDDGYLAGRAIDLRELNGAFECFSLSRDGSDLLMQLRDPLAAHATNPRDKALIGKLLAQLQRASPLNMALKVGFARAGESGAGESGAAARRASAWLSFDTSKMRVDVEHYRIDSEAARASPMRRMMDRFVAATDPRVLFGELTCVSARRLVSGSAK